MGSYFRKGGIIIIYNVCHHRIGELLVDSTTNINRFPKVKGLQECFVLKSYRKHTHQHYSHCQGPEE